MSLQNSRIHWLFPFLPHIRPISLDGDLSSLIFSFSMLKVKCETFKTRKSQENLKSGVCVTSYCASFMCTQQLVTPKCNLYLGKDPFLEGTCDFIWGSQDMVKPPRCLQKLKAAVTERAKMKRLIFQLQNINWVSQFFPPLIVSLKHIITVLPDYCKGAR